MKINFKHPKVQASRIETFVVSETYKNKVE